MSTLLSKKFHPDFIQEVKKRADIVEVASSYTELRKAGKEFVGCCPFHSEGTGSFTVTPANNFFYCFGCGRGGNSIKFLMEAGRVNFRDAVLELARSANIPVRYDDGSTEYDYPDPLPRPLTPLAPVAKEEVAPDKDYTVDEWRVDRSVKRLLSGAGDAAKALNWLASRGITREMVERYRLGLEKRVVKPDESRPDYKEEYWAVAIFIPVADRPGRFYVKKRVAPWLADNERPSYLARWSQFGLPATIWFSYNPPDAEHTYFTEGEWDALLLGELARQLGKKVAVACSTSGAGTIPKQEQLDKLPGQVTIFYDRDEPGEKGAQKLAAALSGRATIGSVPMPDDCQVEGWDASNAILAGYRWENFEAADLTEPEEKIEVTPPDQNGISFKVLRNSLDLGTFPELETEAGKDWLKMRKFTPDHVIDSRYFHWESRKPGTHLAAKSGLGTGKTYHAHNEFLADDNVGANAFGYRNSLLIQFTENGKNWYHLQQDLKESKEDLSLVADPKSRISSCADSLIYFQPQDFEQKRLIMDELEGTFKHIYTAKTAVSFYRQLCKERVGQAIANSEAVILLDGNLSDLTVAHAERISGKKFTKVENLYKGNRGKVTLYTGTLKFGKDEETGQTVVVERRTNDYSLIYKKMMNDPDPFICAADSQEKLEAWHDLLTNKGRKVFRLDGSNSNTPEAKKFLANPVRYIQDNRIEIVLYSPTAESGLNIELEGYFKNGYFFFLGVVSTNEQTQFLDRVRDSGMHRFIFCQNQGMNASNQQEATAQHIQEAFTEYTLACSQISLADIGESQKQKLLAEQAAKLVERSNDVHFRYECHLKAREIFERNHLRKCLEYALFAAGYQVEVVAGFKVDKTELEEAQQVVQVRKSEELFKAAPLSENEAQEKGRKFDASHQDKLEVARHKLVSRLPGIESKTQTVSRKVLLPQQTVDEIKTGKVSLETAQKLGIPTPETPTIQAINLEHLPQNSLNNQGEGVPDQGELLSQRSDGSLEAKETDLGQNKTAQKLDIPTPETPTAQAIDLEHLPLNFSINQGEGVPGLEGAEVEVVITEEKSVFSPEFIRKVKFQDRAWLSKVELHFLLENPEIAKLLQQRRWYKKLLVFSDPNQPDCVKPLNLSTYKSDWLKVHTLLEMGIGFFLNPESRWSKDSPEVIEFWEKGKDARRARYIGTTVGESKPCEYIGRVLNQLDVKRKREQVKNEAGEKVRVYRVDTDYLSSPTRSAVYECVKQRIESHVRSDSTVLNWDAIIENQWAAQNEGVASLETLTVQAIEVEHLPQNFLNNQGEGVLGVEGLEVEESSFLESLREAFGYCQNAEEFASVVEGFEVSREQVEKAIVFADSQPRRKQLGEWLAQLSPFSLQPSTFNLQPSIELKTQELVSHPPLESYREGDSVLFFHPDAKEKWIKGAVESVSRSLLRVRGEFFERMIECASLIAPGGWVMP